MKNSVFLLLGIAFFAATTPFAAARAADPQPPDREKLVRELQTVRSDLEGAQRGLVTNNKELWKKRHDVEYQDAEIVALRDQIVALEKQLIDLRKQLETRVALKPEIKKIEAQRKELFKNIQAMRDQEAVIQREIGALDNAARMDN